MTRPVGRTYCDYCRESRRSSAWLLVWATVAIAASSVSSGLVGMWWWTAVMSGCTGLIGGAAIRAWRRSR